MKSYQVTLTEETWYTVFIEAKSKREAEAKAWELLEGYGTDAFKIEGAEWSEKAHVEETDYL